ncbi:hypothetical protein KDK77_00325 [bacterium]|nr:hypothetical protein [bacterium]
MKIVRSCPVCRRKMRFPVNRGKIMITCPHCGNQFIFDPSIRTIFNRLKAKISLFLYNWSKRIRKRK